MVNLMAFSGATPYLDISRVFYNGVGVRTIN